MPKANKISLDQAKQDKLFYFVANVVIYRPEDGRCLLLKRSMGEKVHPGKYATPGGKLEWRDLDLENPTRMNGDVFSFEGLLEKLSQREVREEAGVEIEQQLHYLSSSVFVRPDGIPVVLVKFAARYVGGEVVLEQGAFDDFAWVNAEEVNALDCIEGVVEEIEETVMFFEK